MMQKLGYYCLLIIGLMTASCARPGSPDGGEKDITPPEIIAEFPANKSLQFKASSFTVSFDEYVKLKDINKQFFVSPPLKNKPEFKLVKKQLRVTFKEDTLQPNTTYRFFFGDAITDLNEGNVLKNYAYTFSTGDYIDSCKLSGVVLDAFTHQPVPETAVWLFQSIEDTLKNPLYVTKANAEGQFLLENLRPDSFYVVSVSDANGDQTYNPTVERAGFIPNAVLASADSLQDTLTVYSFIETKTKLGLSYKRYSDSTKVTLATNRPCDSCYVINSNFEVLASQRFATMNNDSLVFFIKNEALDSVYFQVRDTDSNLVSDTIVLRNAPSSKPPQLARLKAGVQTISPIERCLMQYNLPLDTLQVISARVLNPKDSVKYPVEVVYNSQFELSIFLDTLPAGFIFLDSGSVKGMNGITLDIDSMGCRQGKAEEYGLLNVAITHNFQHPILLLIDSKGKVAQTRVLKDKKSATFSFLKPGKHQLYLFEDGNGDRKWSPGIVSKMALSEKLFIYPDPIEVRANWEFELEWEAK